MLVQNIKIGCKIISARGTSLSVRNVCKHADALCKLVELRAGEAKLTVTASHRVVVPGQTGQRETLAESLRLGQSVELNQGAERLSRVLMQEQSVEIFEVRFQPDEPVEAWHLPTAAILTKGQAPIPLSQCDAVHRWDAQEFSTFVLLKVTRHPQVLDTALMDNLRLRANCDELAQASLPHRLQNGARVFVPGNRYVATLGAIQFRILSAAHIVCSSNFLPDVEAAIGSCPHKDNVRIKEIERINYALPRIDSIVSRTFLEFFDLSCQKRSIESVVNSTTVAHKGHNPRCH